MKKEVSTNDAPSAIGPYSQAIYFDGWLFVSGQIPINPETGKIVDDSIESQIHRVMKNIGAILKESDMDMNNIVKTTIYLSDLNDFNEVNKVYESYLLPPYPARATIEVSRLPKSVDIEIEVLAKE